MIKVHLNEEDLQLLDCTTRKNKKSLKTLVSSGVLSLANEKELQVRFTTNPASGHVIVDVLTSGDIVAAMEFEYQGKDVCGPITQIYNLYIKNPRSCPMFELKQRALLDRMAGVVVQLLLCIEDDMLRKKGTPQLSLDYTMNFLHKDSTMKKQRVLKRGSLVFGHRFNSWSVRGHSRHLQSGRTIYIRPYVKSGAEVANPKQLKLF